MLILHDSIGRAGLFRTVGATYSGGVFHLFRSRDAMKIAVNVFHPHLDQSTVNRRWVEQLAREPGVTVRHLDALYPDRRIDVGAEQAVLLAHDRIVFQHPFYWYSTPPLMKQWLDEVLTYGWAYGPGGTRLAGKEWLSAISTGGPADSYMAGGFNTFSMSELLKPLQQTANLIGMKFLPPFVRHGAVRATPEELAAGADAYAAHALDPLLDPQKRLAELLDQMKEEQVAL